jgi:hypothetical protein
LTSAIEMARANNLPDSVLGQKMYDFWVGKIAYATSVYGVLTGEKTPVVKIQIGEVKYSLAAVWNTTSDKAHQSIPDFVAKLQTEQYEKLVTAGNSKYTSIIAAEKLGKTEAEWEKIQAELAKNEVESKFLDDANRIQNDLLKKIALYVENPNDEVLVSMKTTFAELQNLNKRAEREYVNWNPEVLRKLAEVEEKYKAILASSTNQGKNLISTI